MQVTQTPSPTTQAVPVATGSLLSGLVLRWGTPTVSLADLSGSGLFSDSVLFPIIPNRVLPQRSTPTPNPDYSCVTDVEVNMQSMPSFDSSVISATTPGVPFYPSYRTTDENNKTWLKIYQSDSVSWVYWEFALCNFPKEGLPNLSIALPTRLWQPPSQ